LATVLGRGGVVPYVGTGIQEIDEATGQRRGFRRSVAIPDDVDDPSLEKARGVIVLPLHVYWSGPPLEWDLDNPVHLRQVYQMVLREGTEEEVRRFIDVDQLIRMWRHLTLPPYVRLAWADHLRHLRGIELDC
jgi:hypothetical protein